MTVKKNPITIFFLKLYLEVIIFCYCTKNERNKFLSCFDVCGVKFLICKYRIATFRKPILIHISRNIRSGPHLPNFIKYLDLLWKEFWLDGMLPPARTAYFFVYHFIQHTCSGMRPMQFQESRRKVPLADNRVESVRSQFTHSE